MVDRDDAIPMTSSRSPSPRKRSSPKFASDTTGSSSHRSHHTVINGILKITDISSGVAGTSSLLRLATENAHFTELDLTGCSISKGDELAEAIRSAPNLKRLVLEWNNLGLAKTGVASLCSAIASCKSLKEVDLRSNRIGPTTAAALAHALRNNCSLTSLDLRWNEIGPSGATAFIGLLERNKTLKDLQLAGNGIPSSLQAKIDGLLERNRGLVDSSGALSHRKLSGASSRLKDDKYEGRHLHLRHDLSKIRNNLETLKEECHILQQQQESTNSHLEAVKNELKEESRLRMYVQKEGQEFKEQAMKAREDVAALQGRLHDESNVHNNIIVEAREMHAAAMSQCQALQDEILRLREEHSAELHELADRARKEADYNLSLMNKMDSTLHEHDQLYTDEINKLRLKLSDEIQAREDALKELEKHRSLAMNTKQKWLEEKDAHEQALSNLAAVNSELKLSQSEIQNLTKQISKMKKAHTAELEELQRNVTYYKQAAADAAQKNADFTAERLQLLENIRLLEDKGKLLEKKLELERLQHSEALQNQTMKFDGEKKALEKDVMSARHLAEISQQRVQEMQTEQDQKTQDYDRKLREAESTLCDAIRQQFAQLRVGSGVKSFKFTHYRE